MVSAGEKKANTGEIKRFNKRKKKINKNKNNRKDGGRKKSSEHNRMKKNIKIDIKYQIDALILLRWLIVYRYENC